MTSKLLDLLRIPTHRAPGEAEAECARLQQEGIVDAVLSEDGDALMFGAGVLFRTYYEGKKSTTPVRVYRASDIIAKHQLDQQGMICFAMLAGGDYSKGLHGCGPNKALRAAQQGLGRSLCRYSEAELRTIWKVELQMFLTGSVPVPPDLPDPKILKKYKDPCVCTPEQLHGLRGLRNGWDSRPIDEQKLRSFLRLYFNIWTRGYIRHIVPWLLVRTLSQTQPGQIASNKIYNIKVINSRKNKKDNAEKLAERKITFDPKDVSSLDLTIQPSGEEGEDWSHLETKTDGPFDPTARVDSEILERILQRSVPYALTEAAEELKAKEAKKTKPKKTTAETDDGEHATQRGTKRKPAADTATPSPSKRPRGRPRTSVPAATTIAISIQQKTTSPSVTLTAKSATPQSTVVDLILNSDTEEEDIMTAAVDAISTVGKSTVQFISTLRPVENTLPVAAVAASAFMFQTAALAVALKLEDEGIETVDLT